MVLLLCLLCLAADASAQSREVTERELKAAYLFNFFKYADWPDLRQNGEEAFTIGVLGNDELLATLEEKLKSARPVKGRMVRVRPIRRIQDAADSHIVFIGEAGRDSLKPILDSVARASVLTVSDIQGFAGKGGMIEFVRENDRIGLVIDLSEVEKSGLRLSSNLLRLSRVINPPGKP